MPGHKKIWQALDVAPGGIFVTGLDMQRWGSLVVNCLYLPWESRDKAFQLIFTDCTAIRWEILGDDLYLDEPDADVIGVDLEENQSAVIVTDVFELIVTYGTLTIQKNW